MILDKTSKMFGHLRKLKHLLPKLALLIIYKLFIGIVLGDCDIIYQEAYNICSPGTYTFAI